MVHIERTGRSCQFQVGIRLVAAQRTLHHSIEPGQADLLTAEISPLHSLTGARQGRECKRLISAVWCLGHISDRGTGIMCQSCPCAVDCLSGVTRTILCLRCITATTRARARCRKQNSPETLTGTPEVDRHTYCCALKATICIPSWSNWLAPGHCNCRCC